MGSLCCSVSSSDSKQATGGKDMSSSGFASRAQSAGDKHDNAGAGDHVSRQTPSAIVKLKNRVGNH